VGSFAVHESSERGREAAIDADLIQQLRAGSETALGDLFDRHAQGVFASAMQTSRDRWIAEEVVQETFLALWERAEQFDPARGTLPVWLMAIARHRAIDRLRAAGRHDRAASFSAFTRLGEDGRIDEWLAASGDLVAIGAAHPLPEVAFADKETRTAIDAALADLEPTERRVIVLAYDSGLSQSEIATSLGWPIGTVKTRTRRALRHLRQQLAPTSVGRPTPVATPGPGPAPCP
jgi:RNA polymerase sigma-70 factor (ECF subfamily)